MNRWRSPFFVRVSLCDARGSSVVKIIKVHHTVQCLHSVRSAMFIAVATSQMLLRSEERQPCEARPDRVAALPNGAGGLFGLSAINIALLTE